MYVYIVAYIVHTRPTRSTNIRVHVFIQVQRYAHMHEYLYIYISVYIHAPFNSYSPLSIGLPV